MHYAIEVVTLGEYADPRNVLRLATAADKAGWEGLFVWDHLGYVWGAPAGDPWVILAAAATATQNLRLATSVAPLPRYRPHVLAQTLASLDLLSNGRSILGAGLGGVPQEFAVFGEAGAAQPRAAMLDEGLEVLDRLFSGELVNHRGVYYTVENLTFAPLPLQRPRIPIWIGGESRPALRRAARWDGWIAGGADENGQMSKTPQEMAEKIGYILAQRRATGNQASFDVAMTGYSQPGDTAHIDEYAVAGVTWWLESLHGFRGTLDTLLARVQAGPPA